jgi:Uma2 family endonuclease
MRPARGSDFERTYSPAEYLTLLDQLDRKYELVDGKLVDYRNMAGASEWHALIAANVIRALGNKLSGTPCRVFSGDLILRVPKTTSYRFGDVVVVCGPIARDPDDPFKNKAVLNPKLIVEIASPSTKLTDQTTKFVDYMKIESFQEYLLVEQHVAHVRSFRRQADGVWTTTYATSPKDEAIRLDSLGVSLRLDEVYESVEFPLRPPEA